MTLSMIGGLILVLGAFFTYKGEIFTSVIVYLFADVVWFSIAILRQDYIGAFLIFVGASLGMVAFFKMNNGVFKKTIKKE